jgi:hypothetical protein
MSESASPRAAQTLILSAAPTEEEWGSRNDKWRSDLFELEQTLRASVPDAVQGTVAGKDTKGVELLQVVVDLASAGALTAVVEGYKAWLGQKPERRRLQIGWRIGDRSGDFTADAENIDSGDIATIASEAFKASQ